MNRQSTPLNQLEQPMLDGNEDEQVNDVLQSINETFNSLPQNLSTMPNMDLYAPADLIPIDNDVSTDIEKEHTFHNLITNDIKYSCLSAIIFIIVYFVPIEQLVFKYAAFDKIPFANVYIKAIIAGLLFYFFVRMI